MIRIPADGPGRYVVPALVLLGAGAAVHLLGNVLRTRGAAGDIAGAILLDVIAGQVGAAWYGDGKDAKDLGRGAGLGLGAVVLAVGLAAALGRAKLAPSMPMPLSIPFALLVSAAFAVRTELLHRWLPDRLLGDFRGKPVVLALYSVAPAVLEARWESLVPLAALGGLSVVLLRATRAPLASIGAAFGAHLAATLVAPSVLGARFVSGGISPIDRATGEGAAVLALALAGAAVAVVAWRRRRS